MRLHTGWAALSIAVVIGGCNQDRPTSPAQPSAAQLLGTLPAGRPAPTLDAKFEALVAEIPGFAGLHMDNAQMLILRLTSAGSLEQARNPIKTFLERNGRPNAEALTAAMRLEVARYDFAELASWRRAVTRNLRVTGLILTDIDEAANRLVLGVTDDRSESEIRRLVEELKIPSDAVTIIITTKAVAHAELTDTYRPIYGSLAMVVVGTGTCTLGYTAFLHHNSYVDSTDAFVITNSHCTDDLDASTGQNFCQMNCTIVEGWEVADPARWQYPNDPWLFEYSTCPNDGSLCRYSDAALFKIDTAQFWHATMGVTCTGITLCDSYSIVGWAWPLQFESVRAEGKTTGYSSGSISSSCVDLQQAITDTWFLCQNIAGYTSQAGDSGGPVVKVCTSSCGGHYNPVIALGINWGSGGNGAIFSPIAMVSNELGVAMSAGGLHLTRSF